MIYLDYSATTPLDSEVLSGMMPYLTENYGNSASVYSIGRKAMAAVDSARDSVAQILGVKSSEVYFTSGGSEGDSWIIKSVAENYKDKGKHIVVSAVEHHAIINACKALENDGYEVTYLPVNGDCLVEEEVLEKAVRPDTVLVCIMYANNETGAIQNISALSPIAKKYGAVFFSDAVQAAGKIPLKTEYVDALSLSAHKFYGPKGVGALYVKDGVKLSPIVFGGEQERGKRGGTTNVAGAVGLALALKKSVSLMSEEEERVKNIRDKFVNRVLSEIPNTRLNGKNLLPSSANITFGGIDGAALLFRLDLAGIAASLGSACASGSIGASHVLKAMGMSEEEALSSVRFTFGRFSAAEEADIAADTIKQILPSLKK